MIDVSHEGSKIVGIRQLIKRIVKINDGPFNFTKLGRIFATAIVNFNLASFSQFGSFSATWLEKFKVVNLSAAFGNWVATGPKVTVFTALTSISFKPRKTLTKTGGTRFSSIWNTFFTRFCSDITACTAH